MSSSQRPSPVQMLGAIAAGAAVTTAVICTVVMATAILTEPSVSTEPTALINPPEPEASVLEPFAYLLPVLIAICLAYFSVASLAAAKAQEPRAVLIVGAVLTGTICGLWIGSGAGTGTVWMMWLGALGVSAALSAALWLGSEALHRIALRPYVAKA